tara:strand:- start:501 stop:1889 length:1389 start_codon:yes stop_codon:yes gene_type:complete
MIKKDKIILIFYIAFGFSLVAGFLYVDSTFEKNNLPDVLPQEITELVVKRDLAIDKQSLFLTFQDVKNHHMILPRNILNVEIIDMSENIVVTKSTMIERGIKTNMTLKHQFDPYNTYEIEVMDGDAKGTTAKLIFEGNSIQTNLTAKIDWKAQGILSSILFLPKENVSHAVNTVIDEFVLYSKTHSDEHEKLIDDIYRSTLYRPVDPEGLSHYSMLLRENKITVDEIRQELLESDEGRFTLNPTEVKTIDEINPNTVNVIHSLYEKVLYRPADSDGLQRFGSLMDAGKLSANALEEMLLNSFEKKQREKAALQRIIIEIFAIRISDFDREYLHDIPYHMEFKSIDPRLIKGISNLELESIDYVKMNFPELFDQKDVDMEIDCKYELIGCTKQIEDAIIQYFGLLLDEQKISEEDFRYEDGVVFICCKDENGFIVSQGSKDVNNEPEEYVYKDGQYILIKTTG